MTDRSPLAALAALLVLALPALPASGGPTPPAGRAAGQDDAWTALPLPRLCTPRPLAARPPAPVDPGHVELPRERGRADARGEAPALPAGVLVQMLEELVRGHDLAVEVHRVAPPILVRGPAADVERLVRAVGELDALAERLAIDVEVTLVPARSEAATPPAPGADDVLRSATRVRSGEGFVVGERAATAFVGDYSVEVANDSGAAAPVTGVVRTGHALHATAYRVRGGRAVHVAGVLDLAELEGLDELDPETGDLGRFQQPTVRAAQVAFAGTVAAGESLRVGLAGTGLERPDWTLWVTVRTRPDDASAEGEGWGGLDLALLARRPATLVRAHPGAGLEDLEAERELASDVEPLPASAVAAELESRLGRRRIGGDDLDLSVRAAGPLLLLPFSKPRAWSEARALVGALEEARLAGGRVRLRHGALEADLPVSAGAPARVLVGRESTLLVDYDVEIASETWMPSPRVSPAFDGLCVELLPGPGRASAACWIASSAAPRDASRTTTALGRLQLVTRAFTGDRAELVAGAGPRTVLAGGADAPGAVLELR